MTSMAVGWICSYAEVWYEEKRVDECIDCIGRRGGGWI